MIQRNDNRTRQTRWKIGNVSIYLVSKFQRNSINWIILGPRKMTYNEMGFQFSSSPNRGCMWGCRPRRKAHMGETQGWWKNSMVLVNKTIHRAHVKSLMNWTLSFSQTASKWNGFGPLIFKSVGSPRYPHL